MSRPDRNYRWRAVAASLSLHLVALPLLAEGRPLGAETPQALIQRVTAAGEKGDFGELAACLAPDERNEMAAGLVAAMGMMVAFMGMGGEMAAEMAGVMAEGLSEEGATAEQKAEAEKAQAEVAAKAAALEKKYNAVLAKHGLAEKLAAGPPGAEGGPEALKELLQGVDAVALLTDLMGLFQELDPAGEDADPLGHPIGEVTDLKIEGDFATAKSGGEVIEMVKVDGRWYLKARKGSGPGG